MALGRRRRIEPVETTAAEEVRAAAAAARRSRDALLAEVLSEQGPDGLENLFPWRIYVEVDDEIDWLSPCCSVGIEPNPVWEAVMSKLGCGRRGVRTWALPVGRKSNPDGLLGALRSTPTRVTYMHHRLERLARRGGHPHGGAALYEVPWELRNITELGKTVGYGLHQAFGYVYAYGEPEAPYDRGAVSLNSNGKELFFTCCTIKNRPEGLFLYDGAPNLDLWPLAETRDAVRVLPAHAMAVSAVAESEGLSVRLPERLRTMARSLDDGLLASRAAGAPGEVVLLVGAGLSDRVRLDLEPLADGVEWIRRWRGPSDEARVLIERCEPLASVLVVEPAVVDSMRIASASPEDVIDRPYQRLAVARHLATDVGYINASPVGSGKTPMALVGMREWSTREPRYRALVVCGSSVVGQWASEARRFAGSLAVTVLSSRSVADDLERVSDDEAPQLVICSHDLARRWVGEIAAERWNDLVVDEAQLLKNPSSGRSRAMWALRRRADRAVGLTGTPIDRSLDDLGAILAWVFDDASLFRGERLSRRYDVASRDRLWQALGAYVFRPDADEVSSQMPQLDTHIERVTVHPAELRLARSAHRRLAEAHERMLASLERQARAAADGLERELLVQARADLAGARGAIASGVVLARLAAADPEALSASESTGALLLKREGLLEPASGHRTKRRRVAELVEERTATGRGVLLFTDFSSVAVRLAETLEHAGVTVETLLGGHSASARTDKQLRFQGIPCRAHADGVSARDGCDECIRPSLEALVLTGAGREGLNLQRASTVVMYDLPWIPSHVIQRIGRAQRIGGHGRVEVIVPLVEGTIEERVAAVLIPRIAQSLATLDPTMSVGASLMGFDELAKTLPGDEMDTLRALVGLPAVEEFEEEPVEDLEPVRLRPATAETATDEGVRGERVVLTGRLSSTRAAWRTALEGAGVSVQEVVNARTTVVIAGSGPGEKLSRATELGITVLDEDAARARFGAGAPPSDGGR